ncbi:MAG TPA: SurA N-terminal domain-containing protein, partial [Azonexus sp.]|nr:SurA N-terminal domain-containing protein [Azonexus sp.]
MTPFVRTLVFLIACLGSLFSQVSFAESPEPVEADRIVAVVGSDVITYVELRNRLASALKQLQKQGTPLPPQDVLERQMLERLIMDRAQLQYAKESGMRVDDVQLDQAIGRIAAGNKMSLPEFRAALEKDGLQFASFREDIRNEMVSVRLREREVDSKLVISDGEIDNYLATQ